MLLDATGKPISSKTLQQKPTAEDAPQAGHGLYVSAGGVEEAQNIDAKLKSNLLTRLAHRKASQNRKPSTPVVQKTSHVKQSMALGKEYPGSRPLIVLRAVGWSSTVVYSILNYRRHQLTKREILIRPKEKEEPAFRFNIFEYSPSEILRHPAFDEIDKYAILELFQKVDPYNEHHRKLKEYDKKKDEFSKSDRDLVAFYNQKHLDFHRQRNEDKRNILKLLRNPDPYFSEESSWYYLLTSILEDMLLIDRGAIIKTRNDDGKLIALTPVDGITIRPMLDQYGRVESMLQVVDGIVAREDIPKDDVILMRMNVSPDVYMYGYGIPNMDILWTTVMSDLYIDKGNIDYYRKGGSVPEGFLAVEPPGRDDDIYAQYDKEQLDGIQRQLQSIIMSDFTQVPLLSGGKFKWIDLKGNRRDMQFKELAEYLTRKICAVFQVSPQDVGVLHDLNRSTAESQASLTKSKGLDTVAAVVSHHITSGVVDEFRDEQDLQLWFQEDDPEAIRDWWNVVQGQLQMGYKSINEVKSEQGEDPLPWGDTPMQGLKNWNHEEAFANPNAMYGQGNQAGGGGGGGGGPLPPGLDQVSEAGGGPNPVGMPGQISGISPALGQATEVKSVLTELLEPTFAESYRTMDVEPIVKNILLADTADHSIHEDLLTFTEQPADVDILDSAEYYLENAVRKVGFSYENLGLSLYVQLPKLMYKRENFLKIASYLFKFGGGSSIVDVSPSRAVVNLHSVDALPPLGEEGSYLHDVTLLLRTLALTGSLTMVFVHGEFDEYVQPVEKGETVADILNRCEDLYTLMMTLGAVKLVDDAVTTVALERLEELTAEGVESGWRLGDADMFFSASSRLGRDAESTKRVLKVWETKFGDQGGYYARLVRAFQEYQHTESMASLSNTLTEMPYNSAFNRQMKAIWDTHSDSRSAHRVGRELYVRMHAAFPHPSSGMALLAYVPDVVKEVSVEEGLEAVEEFRTYYQEEAGAYISAHLPNAVVGVVEYLSDLGYEFSEGAWVFGSPETAYVDEHGDELTEILTEPELRMGEISQELHEVAIDFSNFVGGFSASPFVQITVEAKELVHNALMQSCMLAALLMQEHEYLRQVVSDMFAVQDIVIELPESVLLDAIEVTDVIDEVAQFALDEYYMDVVDGDYPMVKSIVGKVLRGEELSQFEKAVTKLWK